MVMLGIGMLCNLYYLATGTYPDYSPGILAGRVVVAVIMLGWGLILVTS
jgi:hypothetical protein